MGDGHGEEKQRLEGEYKDNSAWRGWSITLVELIRIPGGAVQGLREPKLPTDLR
jgi:hypothetical protein